MTKRYMHYDPLIDPSPALGWYDTGLYDYKNTIPPLKQLFEVTKDEWDRRLTEHLGIRDGRVDLVPPRSALSK